MRDYGTTNIAQYAAAPPVGNLGDMYYNTTNGVVYIVGNGPSGLVWNDGESTSWKAPVRLTPAQSQAALTLTGLLTVDGVATAVGDRVLARNQGNPLNNCIWVVQTGAWTRPPDFNMSSDVLGAAVYVTEGTTLAGSTWVCTNTGSVTLGTTGLLWSLLSPTRVVGDDGWTWSPFAALPVQNREIIIQDSPAFSEMPNYTQGTKIHLVQGTDYYAAVILTQKGTNNTNIPLTATYNGGATPVTFTATAHGFVNGDVIYGTPQSGILTTQWTGGTVAWYVVGVTANTFNLSRTRGGTAVNSNAGANGSVLFNSGTYLTLSPSADFGLNAAQTAVPLIQNQYSRVFAPKGWPGWFNYTTAQVANPLTFIDGYSVIPTGLVYQFRVDGNMCTYVMHDGASGTSNAITLTVSLPIPAANTPAGQTWAGSCSVVNSSANINTPGRIRVPVGAVNASVDLDHGGSNWATSLGKRVVYGTVQYQI